MGSVWSTVLELRNAPISRIFVNEIGQLIFDDSYGAWTGVNLDGTIPPSTYDYGKISGVIGSEEIREFEFGFDDASMITFLSVTPSAAMLKLGFHGTSINFVDGLYVSGSGFANGLATAQNPGQAHVNVYGYRYGNHESQFDLTYDDAADKRKVFLELCNNLYTGSVTLRGRPTYRVGKRYTINVDTGRPQTSDQTWYVSSVQQQGTWGEDWTTTLEVRYPTVLPDVLSGEPSGTVT